jgi:hypothetical protein
LRKLSSLNAGIQLNNPDFNYGEFATIKNKAGLNNFKIGVKEFSERTNAISLRAKAGRYGGTYAHQDVALEFAMWISAEFKVYLVFVKCFLIAIRKALVIGRPDVACTEARNNSFQLKRSFAGSCRVS